MIFYFKHGIIDEPLGGAHVDPEICAQSIKHVLEKELKDLLKLPVEELLKRRYDKYRAMGDFEEQ